MFLGLGPSDDGPVVLWVAKLVQSAVRAYTLNNNIKEMKPC
jgi:hypothetical protein